MSGEGEEARTEDGEIGKVFAFEVDGGEEIALDLVGEEHRPPACGHLRRREAVSGHGESARFCLVICSERTFFVGII